MVKATLREFREAYNRAVEGGSNHFSFKGQLLLTSYAKYVLEYLTRKCEHTGMGDEHTFELCPTE